MQENVLNSLPIIAHAIGRKCGVKVCVNSGTQAYTDGRTVVLPNTPSIPRDALLGYLVHESAHIRYTDFTVQRDSKVIAWLTNVYEDARIERKIAKEYIGASRLLLATMRYLHKDSVEMPEDKIEQILNFVALDCWFRHRPAADPLKEEYEFAKQTMSSLISRADEKAIQAINDELLEAKTTSDCLILAKKLLDLLKTLLASNEQMMSEADSNGSNPKKTGKPGKSGNPGKKGSGSNESNAESQSNGVQEKRANGNDDKNGDESEGYGSGGYSASGSEASQSKSSSNEAGNSNGASQSNQNIGLNLEQAPVSAALQTLYDISSSMKSEIEQSVATPPILPQIPLGIKCSHSKDFTDKARRMLEAGRRNSIGLRRQLQGLVQAQSRTQKRLATSGRSFNARKLSRLTTWNPCVFNRLKEHQGTATAVHILVDMSGSMRGLRESIAAESALALFLALETLPDCNPAISTFQSRRTTAIFRHGETLNEVTKCRISSIEANGGTPLDRALGDVLVELATTKEKRKVIFVITDGDPDSPRETHNLVKAIEKCPDVDIVGIGICSDTSWLFKKSVRLDDVTKLPEVLFGLAKDLALAGIQ